MNIYIKFLPRYQGSDAFERKASILFVCISIIGGPQLTAIFLCLAESVYLEDPLYSVIFLFVPE